MTGLAILALVACVVWFVRRGPSPRTGRPQYTGALPNPYRQEIDQEELTRAEKELAEDPRPRSLGDRAQDEDDEDWGPGTGR